jgi:hypothetical protein
MKVMMTWISEACVISLNSETSIDIELMLFIFHLFIGATVVCTQSLMLAKLGSALEPLHQHILSWIFSR